MGRSLHEVLRIKGLQKVGHFVDAVAHRSLLLVGIKATYSRITLENSVQSADAIGNKIEHKRAILSVVKKARRRRQLNDKLRSGPLVGNKSFGGQNGGGPIPRCGTRVAVFFVCLGHLLGSKI